jgi:hypothetical protein
MTLESEPISEHDQTPNTSGKPDTQASQGNRDIPRAPSIPSPPPAKTHCEITCKTEKTFWDHVKTGVEILGIILLGIYTGYTIKMYCANKKAADAAMSAAETAKQALIIGQRPWVGPEKEPEVLLALTQQGIQSQITLHVNNFGPSPALNLSYYMQPDALTDRKHTDDISNYSCTVAEIPAKTADALSGKGNFGALVLPKEPFRIYDNRGWNPDKTTDYSFVVVGCIAYADGFHNTPIHSPIHHTRFCFRTWQPIKDFIPTSGKPVQLPLYSCSFAEGAD